MISFLAHSSYGFHLIKLLFVCCWIEGKCGELQSDYSIANFHRNSCSYSLPNFLELLLVN